MAAAAQRMLRQALDAVINLDAGLARQVCVADDEVDALNHEVARRVKDAMRRDPEAVEVLVQLLLVARHIERIADQATNVAEDAIYMVEGRIVRHHARPEDG
jgi:phosphate transport system protein